MSRDSSPPRGGVRDTLQKSGEREWEHSTDDFIQRALLNGWRIGDFFVLVNGGQCLKFAKDLFKEENVFEVSIRVNAVANVIGRAYFKELDELQELLEGIRKNAFVEKVEFSEICRIATKSDAATLRARPVVRPKR